jgi:TPR repeat protein
MLLVILLTLAELLLLAIPANSADDFGSGQGWTDNERAVASLLLKAAEERQADDMAGLEALRASGPEGRWELEASLRWIKGSAEKGVAPAQAAYGELFHYGQDAPLDLAEARRWYLKSAEGGFAEGQYRLAAMLYRGEGGPRDLAGARRWFLEASMRGHGRSQAFLSVMLRDGEGGPADLEGSKRWLGLACEKMGQDALSGKNSGRGLPRGEMTEKEIERANVRRMTYFAEQGLDIAQYTLACMYEAGYWVPVDLELARRWYAKAAAQGMPEAIERLKRPFVGAF